jgi:hypothetical protein
MATIEEKLEELFAKVRSLSKDRQEVAAIALAEIVEEEVYILSDEELAVLEPRLRDAERGENLIDAKDVDILNKPWR